MTYKELKNEIKEEQKTLALQIRRGKYLRKPDHRTNITKDDKKLYYYDLTFDDWNVYKLSQKYREKHIAYCKTFNRTPYGLIENPREGNSPNKSRIEEYENQWENRLDEALRISA